MASAGKIRRGLLNINGADKADVANFQWDDKLEFDRKAVDTELSGKPVLMKKSGSGSFELLAGVVPSGYATAAMTFKFKQVTVTAGTETVLEKTLTFEDVTFNHGGSVDNDSGPGSKKISFDYSTCIES
jgi:hypothetical protein